MGQGVPAPCGGGSVAEGDSNLRSFLPTATLGRSHLQDLKDITHNVHYESYRVRRLNESNQPGPSPHNGLPGKSGGGSDL